MTNQTQQINGLQDFLFIGSGISSSFTLWNLLKNLKSVKISRPIQITVIDKYPEYHKGIPYGQRSGKTVLLITSLRSFLPEPELTAFMQWLSTNKDWLLKEFQKDGGSLSEEWLKINQESIDKNEWSELFIPRYFFGCYMDEQLDKIIHEMEAANQIQIHFKNAKVINIIRMDDLWMADTEKSGCITTKKVIMGIGSLPTKFLWKEKRVIREKDFLFLNDSYSKNLNYTLDKIRELIASNPGQKINVVIVGSNASALEVLYKLNDLKEIGDHCDKFYFLSTYGLLPDSVLDSEKLKNYKPKNLLALASNSKISSSDIDSAAQKDLDKAAKLELGAFSTVGVISNIIGELLGRLDPLELENFACIHGNEIGRRQRCAGLHYVNTVKMLEKEGRFKHIAGRFHDVSLSESGAKVFYQDTKSGTVSSLDESISLVINCSGSMTLDSPKIPAVLRKLMQKDVLIPNVSRIGFQVNDRFEAKQDFHVIGPLLAGNVIDNKAVWHVEHCGRIIWLSKILADILANPIVHQPKLQATQFKILHIGSNEEDQKTYTQALNEIAGGNPHGSISYFAHHQIDMNQLMAFQFISGGRTIALMPLVLRTITSKKLKTTYFDVISPYGYSGPLFTKGLQSFFKDEFWRKVDQWYKENNVVSEFIRFNLNNNHLCYSGELKSSLKNVKGKILQDQKIQWSNYVSKVRTNYRKATKYDLSFHIAKGVEISDSLITEFHRIYTKTMDRNKASSIYFFSLDYFLNLIHHNPEKFAIAMVKKDEVVCSVELIINHENTIYAYLGGTRQEYFQMRPNDFLRVEVIRWAAAKKLDYYILGGGRKDDDGLYRYKKSLFPKDPDIIFYTGRKIILEEEYTILLNEHIKKLPVFFDTVQSTFFPAYRI